MKWNKFGGQVSKLSLSNSSNSSWTFFVVWEGALSCWKRQYGCLEVLDVQQCYVGGTCQIISHMNVRIQGFPTEDCSEYHTSSSGLPSSHNPMRSWFIRPGHLLRVHCRLFWCCTGVNMGTLTGLQIQSPTHSLLHCTVCSVFLL